MGERTARALGGVLGFLAAALSPACSEPCCTYDSQPIPLEHGGKNQLLAMVSIDGAPKATAVIDTGTPIAIWNAPLGDGLPEVKRRTIYVLGPGVTPRGTSPTRAILRRIQTVAAPLGMLEGTSDTVTPVALLGGDLFSNFSVEIGFGGPQLVLWQEQPATDA